MFAWTWLRFSPKKETARLAVGSLTVKNARGLKPCQRAALSPDGIVPVTRRGQIMPRLVGRDILILVEDLGGRVATF